MLPFQPVLIPIPPLPIFPLPIFPLPIFPLLLTSFTSLHAGQDSAG